MIRKILINIFKNINPGDINITHHWTKDKIKLHSFKHKGYWFYGKKREHDTMVLFSELIEPTDNVFEVGGHIAYISLYYAMLAPQGKVYVFEPGDNNLPYTRNNIKSRSNITLIEKGIGDKDEVMQFFQEDLTGQNNSFVKDFKGLQSNAEVAGYDLTIDTKDIQVIKFDTFIKEEKINKVDFIKIDIEGFEYFALLGMVDTLKNLQPKLMVEVQENQEKIFELFNSMGYFAFDEDKNKVDKFGSHTQNYFFLHKDKHSTLIAKLKK